MITRVENVEDVAALATRILGPRARPLVVVSSDPATGTFVLDIGELHTEVEDLAELALITTGDLTYALDEHLPDRTQVYGGAGRSYPADFAANPDWRRSPLRFPGSKATGHLIGDVLAQANEAGLFRRPASARQIRVSGRVLGLIADGTRAVIDAAGHGFATVWRELTYPPFPLDWVLHTGQEIEGTLDLDAHRMLVETAAPNMAALAKAFPHRSATLAFVKKVTASRALLLLHPTIEHAVRRGDISVNPLDTVDLLLAEGDVVAVRVAHLSDGTLHLSLVDVDDDEPLVPSLALTTGGRPWLVEGRALIATPDTVQDELVALEGPAQVSPTARTREHTEAAPADGSAPERATGSPPVPPARPCPGPGRRVVHTPAAQPVDAEPTRKPMVVDADSVPTAGSALHSTQLQLTAARAQIAELERRLVEAGADDSSIQRLQALVSGTRARLQQELAERGELERKIRELEEQRRNATLALRNARKTAASDPAAQDDQATRRADWTTDEGWVKHEVHLAWIKRMRGGDRDTWPLRDYTIGPDFTASLGALDEGQFDKAMRATVDAVTGRIRTVAGRDVHPLRTGDGGGDTDVIRPGDNARCWRASIEQQTAAARRLHYWTLPGGAVELSRVVTHDDTEP